MPNYIKPNDSNYMESDHLSKVAAIEKYCASKVTEDCTTCPIEELCDKCDMFFMDYEDITDAAYDILFGEESGQTEEPDKPDNTEPNEHQDHHNDHVNHPNHYASGSIECIDAMESAFGKDAVSNFCLLNAFKYIWRSEKKNGAEDIKKAIWYLEKYLSFISFEKEDNTDENKL